MSLSDIARVPGLRWYHLDSQTRDTSFRRWAVAKFSPGEDKFEPTIGFCNYLHVMVGSNDIARSKKFYDALFGAIGGSPGVLDANGRLIYANNGGLFLVTKPIDGKAATHANGGTIGIAMAGPEQADAWHKAGVANGGTAIEDPPGVRQSAIGPLYLAYIRDPDGNKLCALHRVAAT